MRCLRWTICAYASLLIIFAPFLAEAKESDGYIIKILQKGEYKFPDKSEEVMNDCPHQICTCEADIDYVEFHSAKSSDIFTQINHTLKKDAEEVSCGLGISTSYYTSKMTYLSDDYASVLVNGTYRDLDAGGSCHGLNRTYTFDAKTAKQLYVKDIVDSSNLTAFREAITTSIAEGIAYGKGYYMNDEKDKGDIENVASEIRHYIYENSDEQLLGMGFYIKEGKVYVNTDEYFQGCAGGNFHPGQLPEALISNKEFLSKLHKQPRM